MKKKKLLIAVSIATVAFLSGYSCSTEKNMVWEEKPIEFIEKEVSFCDTTHLYNMKIVQLENKGNQSVK